MSVAWQEELREAERLLKDATHTAEMEQSKCVAIEERERAAAAQVARPLCNIGVCDECICRPYMLPKLRLNTDIEMRAPHVVHDPRARR